MPAPEIDVHLFSEKAPEAAHEQEQAPKVHEAAEQPLPIEHAARALGGAFWTSIPASATAQAFEGPGWLLAAVVAGNKLESTTSITKSKLQELGKEASSHAFGHSAHPLTKKA